MNIRNETYRGYLLEAAQPETAWRWSAFAEQAGLPPPPDANRRRYETAEEALTAAKSALDALFNPAGAAKIASAAQTLA